MVQLTRETCVMNLIKTCLFQLCLAALLLQTAKAGDAYYNLPLSKLTVTTLAINGESPSAKDMEGRANRRWQVMGQMKPYAVLDGGGEVYVTDSNDQPWQRAVSYTHLTLPTILLV